MAALYTRVPHQRPHPHQLLLRHPLGEGPGALVRPWQTLSRRQQLLKWHERKLKHRPLRLQRLQLPQPALPLGHHLQPLGPCLLLSSNSSSNKPLFPPRRRATCNRQFWGLVLVLLPLLPRLAPPPPQQPPAACTPLLPILFSTPLWTPGPRPSSATWAPWAHSALLVRNFASLAIVLPVPVVSSGVISLHSAPGSHAPAYHAPFLVAGVCRRRRPRLDCSEAASHWPARPAATVSAAAPSAGPWTSGRPCSPRPCATSAAGAGKRTACPGSSTAWRTEGSC